MNADKFIIDSNIILRILVPERTGLTQSTLDVLKKVQEGAVEFIVTDMVVAECVHVLTKYYEISREETANVLIKFLQVIGVSSSDLIQQTLSLYKNINLDITDIYLSVVAKSKDMKILTWDKGFKKLNAEYYKPNQL